MEQTQDTKLYQRLSRLLHERGMTQKAFADQIGASPSTVSTWMHLRTDYIPSNYIMPICDLLGVSPEQLLTGKPREQCPCAYDHTPENERRMVEHFRRCDWDGQQIVIAAAITEARRASEAQEKGA